jgi:hypothetical protein
MANKMANDFTTRASTASTPDPLRQYTVTLGIAASYSRSLYENALPPVPTPRQRLLLLR